MKKNTTVIENLVSEEKSNYLKELLENKTSKYEALSIDRDKVDEIKDKLHSSYLRNFKLDSLKSGFDYVSTTEREEIKKELEEAKEFYANEYVENLLEKANEDYLIEEDMKLFYITHRGNMIDIDPITAIERFKSKLLFTAIQNSLQSLIKKSESITNDMEKIFKEINRIESILKDLDKSKFVLVNPVDQKLNDKKSDNVHFEKATSSNKNYNDRNGRMYKDLKYKNSKQASFFIMQKQINPLRDFA